MVAHAPAEVRMQRLVALRGLSHDDAAARIASQVPDERRLALADVVVDTGGALQDTLRQADELWRALPRLIAERRSR